MRRGSGPRRRRIRGDARRGGHANEYTYDCVLKSISRSARPAMTMATAMHETGLTEVYFKRGKVKLAVRVFEEMPERDVIA